MRDYLTSYDHDGVELADPIPLTCGDCDRPVYYDEDSDTYHHAFKASEGCFLINAEDRPDDMNHPYMVDGEVCKGCGPAGPGRVNDDGICGDCSTHARKA